MNKLKFSNLSVAGILQKEQNITDMKENYGIKKLTSYKGESLKKNY